MPIYFTPQLQRRWSGPMAYESPGMDPALAANLQNAIALGSVREAERQRRESLKKEERDKEEERLFRAWMADQEFRQRQALGWDQYQSQYDQKLLDQEGQAQRDLFDASRRENEMLLGADLQAQREATMLAADTDRRAQEQAHQRSMRQEEFGFRADESAVEHERTMDRLGFEQGNALERMAAEFQYRDQFATAGQEAKVEYDALSALNEEISARQKDMLQHRDQLTPEGRRLWGDLSGELTAIRRATLRPEQQKQALGAWLKKFYETRMEDQIAKPPTMAEEWQQNTFVDPETGHKYQRSMRNGASEFKLIETPKPEKAAAPGKDPTMDLMKQDMDLAVKLMGLSGKKTRNLETGEETEEKPYNSLDDALEAAIKMRQRVQGVHGPAAKPPDPGLDVPAPAASGRPQRPGDVPQGDVWKAAENVYNAVKRWGKDVPLPYRPYHDAVDLLRKSGADVDSLIAGAESDRLALQSRGLPQPPPVEPAPVPSFLLGADAGPVAPRRSAPTDPDVDLDVQAQALAAEDERNAQHPDITVREGTPEAAIARMIKSLLPGQALRLPDGRIIRRKRKEL